MSEKPLHVRVAEALGWSCYLSKHGHFIVTHGIGSEVPGERCEEGFGTRNDYSHDPYTGKRLPEREDWWNDCSHIPRYDTDWSATGPLIERFRMYLYDSQRGEWVAQPGSPLADDPSCQLYGAGRTPLLAVCYLILALAEAGKLKETA